MNTRFGFLAGAADRGRETAARDFSMDRRSSMSDDFPPARLLSTLAAASRPGALHSGHMWTRRQILAATAARGVLRAESGGRSALWDFFMRELAACDERRR